MRTWVWVRVCVTGTVYIAVWRYVPLCVLNIQFYFQRTDLYIRSRDIIGKNVFRIDPFTVCFLYTWIVIVMCIMHVCTDWHTQLSQSKRQWIAAAQASQELEQQLAARADTAPPQVLFLYCRITIYLERRKSRNLGTTHRLIWPNHPLNQWKYHKKILPCLEKEMSLVGHVQQPNQSWKKWVTESFASMGSGLLVL